jgi:hypothetical protein
MLCAAPAHALDLCGLDETQAYQSPLCIRYMFECLTPAEPAGKLAALTRIEVLRLQYKAALGKAARHCEHFSYMEALAALNAKLRDLPDRLRALPLASRLKGDLMKYDIAFTNDGVSVTLTANLGASEFRSLPPATHAEPTHPLRILEQSRDSTGLCVEGPGLQTRHSSAFRFPPLPHAERRGSRSWSIAAAAAVVVPVAAVEVMVVRSTD